MTLVLDGAMGTELSKRGVQTKLPLWTAESNISHPYLVEQIHKEYIQSGADIITTNTFRSTSWSYMRAGFTGAHAQLKAKESLYSAVECAHKASKGVVKVAGSITTLNDCYEPEKFPGRNVAIDIYGQTLDWLIDSGVDMILFETMGNLEEIDIGLSLSSKHRKSIWLSVIMKSEKEILDGTFIEKILRLANQYSVEAILINCNKILSTIVSLKIVRTHWAKKWGAYPNLGVHDYSNEYFNIITKTQFIAGMKNILNLKPNIIGCCCGSTPLHIKFLKKLTKRNR